MTAYFFDSSALVKRHIVEPGTQWVRSVVGSRSGNRIIIAQITPVEVTSAATRLVRDKTISHRTALAIQAFLNRHVQREYVVVVLSQAIIQNAQRLLHLYSLKAYDAVQLASALDSNTRLVAAQQAPLIFVSADVRLLAAATAEGLPTHHPI